MRRERSGVRWLALALLLAGTPHCRRRAEPERAAPDSSTDASPPEVARAPGPSAEAAKPAAPPLGENTDKEEPPEAAAEANAAGESLVLHGVADVGPAGPAVATERGVAMVTRSNDVVLAALTSELAAFGSQAPSPLTPLPNAASEFVSLGRAPAAANRDVFWITGGKLWRKRLGGAAPQALAADARDGTRVAVALGPKGSSAAVAYIARSGSDHLVARLWVEGKPSIELSPAGSAANSVALVSSGEHWLSVFLEARTGMTPVHARRIHRATLQPEEDVVVWVGGSAGPFTELSAVATPDDVWAFVPLERDISHFGLARIRVGREPRMNAAVSWRLYPNGLDPAPLDAATICDRAAVVYVRPSEAAPRSPRELHFAWLDDAGLSHSTVIARGRQFTDVSLSRAPGGGLIAYVADRRTWARTLACKRPARRVGAP